MTFNSCERLEEIGDPYPFRPFHISRGRDPSTVSQLLWLPTNSLENVCVLGLLFLFCECRDPTSKAETFHSVGRCKLQLFCYTNRCIYVYCLDCRTLSDSSLLGSNDHSFAVALCYSLFALTMAVLKKAVASHIHWIHPHCPSMRSSPLGFLHF